jgi:hypothetical protein
MDGWTRRGGIRATGEGARAVVVPTEEPRGQMFERFLSAARNSPNRNWLPTVSGKGHLRPIYRSGKLLYKSEVVMETRVSGQTEARFTGAIESQTSKVPSSAFLGIAIGCMATSLILKLVGKDDWALFVGQWPPALLIMGNYNKMVKQHGSDARSGLAA